MSKFIESIAKATGVIPKNINEQIAECKAEIAELEGNGTIVSAVINFAKEGGKALFSSASSSDNGKKDPEDKHKKLSELKEKLANLSEKFANLSEKERPQGQDGESSDSPDGLSDDELNGDLADYVNKLNGTGTPYEVVRGKGGMIGIKTATRGGDSNSMSNVFKNMMEKVAGESWGSPEESSVDKASVSTLDEKTKSQLNEVVNDLKKAEGIESDDKKWYNGDNVLNTIRNKTKMDPNDENVNSELLGITQSEIFEMQIENAKAIADKGKTALMPINIGENHWVAGAMTKDQKGNYQMIHNDSLGNPIDEKLSETLEKSGVGIVDLKQRQQEDSYNCGPFTADNLVKFSEAIETNKETGLDITSDEFKKDLSKELGKNGDEIRKGQNLSPPTTPKVGSQKKEGPVR